MPLQESDHNRKDTRVLVLRVKEGGPRSSTGLLDHRLFTNENNLRAVMDPTNCLWSFKYDSGQLPPALFGRWTSFDRLLKFAKSYFERRNVEIVNVID